MKTSLLFSVLILAACSSKQVTLPVQEMQDPAMWEFHYFFDRYLTSVDSAEGKTIKTYSKLNLVRVGKHYESTYIIKADTVFIGNHKESDYQVEVYKEDYLVISMVKGRSYVAGPDYFPRDSTIFISFETGAIKTANLPGIRFTRSQEFLTKVYRPSADGSPGKYFAIATIDFGNNQLTLLGDNGLKYNHSLKSYEGIYRFGP